MKLSEYVYQDLTARIQSGENLPYKLTYSGMSQHYQISLTPIRAAIKRLLDDKLLVCLENGRLRVSEGVLPPADACPAARRPGRPVDVEALIRKDLIRQSLQGERSFLREEAAAAHYGIGRTALRPVFSRLAGIGLLEHVPRCGWRVRAFDKNDLCSFIEVREVLELKALTLAHRRLDAVVLRDMLAENSQGELGSSHSPHSYWIELSRNRYIQDFFRFQSLYYLTLFDFAAPETRVVREMAAQHCEILTALLASQFGTAKKALVHHIRAQKPVVLQLIDQVRAGNGKPKVSA